MDNWTTAQEAEKLAARFKGVVRRHFAQEINVPGGERMVYQHIKGIRPISLEAAKAYAKGFNCSLSEISPRLADEIAGAAPYADKETPVTTAPTVQPLWPFTWVDEDKIRGLKRDDLIKRSEEHTSELQSLM